MSLQKYNNRDYLNVPSSFDGLFDALFAQPLRSIERHGSDFLSPSSSITEDDQIYTISMDLPGVKKEDINIEKSEKEQRKTIPIV